MWERWESPACFVVLNAKQCNYYKKTEGSTSFTPQSKDNTTLYAELFLRNSETRMLCVCFSSPSVQETGDVKVQAACKAAALPSVFARLMGTTFDSSVHTCAPESTARRNLDNCSRTKEQLGCHEHTWRLPSTHRETGSGKDLHLQPVLNMDKLLWIFFPLRATV